MSTYTKNLTMENTLMAGLGLSAMFAGKGYTVSGIKAKAGTRAKNVALFFAAPFIGLAYLLAFPVVGLAMLAWIAAKAVMNNEKTRPVAMLIAAPLAALAFVTVGPLAGLAAAVWFGGKALLRA